MRRTHLKTAVENRVFIQGLSGLPIFGALITSHPHVPLLGEAIIVSLLQTCENPRMNTRLHMGSSAKCSMTVLGNINQFYVVYILLYLSP